VPSKTGSFNIENTPVR